MGERNLVDGNLGTVGSYDLDLVNGTLVFRLNAGIPQVKGSIGVEVDVGEILDLIAAKIPGQVDDAVFGVIKMAVKAI